MFWNQFGYFIDLDPDPYSSNFVDQDPDTINPDPHYWIPEWGPLRVVFSGSDLKSRKYHLYIYKYIYPKNLFCCLWANYLCLLNKIVISVWKIMMFMLFWLIFAWIFLDFGRFFWLSSNKIRNIGLEDKNLRHRRTNILTT